jgi:hypothetical protein
MKKWEAQSIARQIAEEVSGYLNGGPWGDLDPMTVDEAIDMLAQRDPLHDHHAVVRTWSGNEGSEWRIDLDSPQRRSAIKRGIEQRIWEREY